MLRKEMTPAIFLLLCLDILMDTEADFVKEIRYLSGLMHQNCHDASWRMEQLLSKVEQGESLDTRSTSIQLREARGELHLLMRGSVNSLRVLSVKRSLPHRGARRIRAPAAANASQA
jgi:hypothetical protein